MKTVRVGEVENTLFECGNFVVHFVGLDVRLELCQVIDGTFAVSRSNHVGWVLTNIGRNFAPRRLYGCDRVCKGTVLRRQSQFPTKGATWIMGTHHIKEDSINEEG